MSLALQLIQQIGVGAAGQAGVTLYRLASTIVRDYLKSKGPIEVRDLFDGLQAFTPADIHALVREYLPGSGAEAQRRREELAAILIKMTRSARSVSSQETSSSLVVNLPDIIEQVVSQLETKRHPGERAIAGLEDWVLTRFLGAGAFGEVWLGRNRNNRDLAYAFKYFTLDGAKEWVQREQETLVHVKTKLGNERRIAGIVNIAVSGQTYPSIMLEYVAGGSLEDWIRREPASRPPLAKQELFNEIVRGMAVAHGAGVFHRDLKPANILLTAPPDIQAKISDFGLGELRLSERRKPKPADDTPRADQTASRGQSTASQVGTPMYWPPEAWLPFAERTPALDDVFALGVVWYQLLVEKLERPPYDFAEVLRSRGEDSHTIRVLSRCLAGPERRFSDARMLLESIENGSTGGDIELPPGSFNVVPLGREFLALQSN